MFSTLQGFTAETNFCAKIRKFARVFRKISPRIPHSLPKEIRENKFCEKKTLLLRVNFCLYTGWVKEKCDLRHLMQNCTFFVQLSMFFLVLQWPKRKSANLFSLKIKSSEKQKCVYKLFLSKSKNFLKIESKNHRKFTQLFWSNFKGKVIYIL